MTCIAAVRDPSKPAGVIVLGADSSLHRGNALTDAGSQKLFFVKLPHVTLLIGFAGQLAYGTTLRYGVDWPDLSPELGESPTRDGVFVWLHRAVAPSIRKGLSESQVESGDHPEGTALIGLAWGKDKERKTLLVQLVDDQFADLNAPYAAVGSGEDFALGVMSHIFDKKAKPNPKSTVVDALTAAERHNAGVRGPFYITELK